MAEALEAHERARSGPHRQLVGPFICPVARLDELEACVAGGVPRPPALSLVIYKGEQRPSRMIVRPGVVQVEAPLGVRLPDEAVRVQRYLELPSDGDVRVAVDEVVRLRARVKVRCGGLTPDMVPTPARLAEVISACAARRVPFKATAGLHHPFRHYEASIGGPQHGFLNLLAAASAATTDVGLDVLIRLLETEESDANTVVERIDRHSRELLAAIGSCSIDEPVADLQALGLL
ncbi:MAG TPA: hypothetical protein VGJ86_26115 [Acidimicrobiales bacterium]|jgi:hypothetical protein